LTRGGGCEPASSGSISTAYDVIAVIFAAEFVDVAAGDGGGAIRAGIPSQGVEGDNPIVDRDHTAVVGRRGVFQACQGFAAGLAHRIGALQDHVTHDRPAHVLGKVWQRLVEPMLGERTANGAGGRMPSADGSVRPSVSGKDDRMDLSGVGIWSSQLGYGNADEAANAAA